MNYASTAEHLRVLESESILQVHVYGRIKMYRFNECTARAKAVAGLIEVWEQK
jgi:hypothetical protein